jgi:UDP-glucuronate decarboxylase
MLGTLNMLGLAKRCGARFLLASTSEVYGDPQVSPQSETYLGNVNCTGPRACYDEGKRIAETLAFDYLRVHGLQVRVARIFNTYGPRMSPTDGRVVTNFIHQALRAKPLTVYGDGSQTRSFCYVDDLVAGLQALMDSSCLHPVNLGNPAEITVAQLAQQVIAKLNPHLAVSFRPLPVDDPRQRRPDISRAQRELGWLPKVSLDDGLNRMVASIKHGQSTPFTKTEIAAPV